MKKGFSLVELSIVLTIIGILATASLSVSGAKGDVYKIKQTKNKLDLIEKAIAGYVKTRYRLPCPAIVTLTPSSTSYGVENCSSTTTTTVTPPSGFSCSGTASSKVSGGMIPFATLNLPKEVGIDGWGNKIMYNVTQALSDSTYSATVSYNDNIAACNMGLINIYGPGSSARATGAAYVILSYGPNGYYGYPEYTSSSANSNIASTNSDETVNGSIASSSYLQAEPTSAFDDIVRYKMRWQVIREAGAVTDGQACIYAKTLLETPDSLISSNAFNSYCTNQPNSPDCASALYNIVNILNQKMCLLK